MYKVTLLSKRAVKWPRYKIELPPGLTYKDATSLTFEALGTNPDELTLLSHWKYDPKTGVADTRIRRQKIDEVKW